jgi:heat-inducible transcriptional repressor
LIDERKKQILKSIIEDYIHFAEPVGSRTISRRLDLNLSSATVRNEMSDLEDMGYIAQPHTSAGRVPTEKGYRMYVDELMKLEKLTTDEIETIHNALDAKINELSHLIRNAAYIISRITNYTSVSMTKQTGSQRIKALQIVPIENRKALVIVVSSSGAVRNNIVILPATVLPDEMIRMSNMLNDTLKNCELSDFSFEFVNRIWNEYGIDKGVLLSIMEGIAEGIYQIENPEVYTSGTANIFNFPEFMDVYKAKQFLDLMDEKRTLREILSKAKSGRGVTVLIGTETEMRQVEGLSLVTATYRLNDVSIGSIGIIGPVRMEYSKVISSMNIIKKAIGEEIRKMLGDSIDIK